MDVLSEVLTQARAKGAVFSVLRKVEPWGLAFSGTRPLTVHIVLDGEAWLECKDREPIRMGPHDVVLMGRGDSYAIVGSPGTPAEPIGMARRAGSDRGEGASATVLCGAYVVDGSVGRSILAGLPRPVVIPSRRQEGAQRDAVRLLASEFERDGTGQQALLDRLLDVNLVYAIRTWWSFAEDARPDWYAALSDPRLRILLEQLHAHVDAPWTLTEMARVASLSRATLARRFTERVGISPARYLAGIRMQRAEDALVRSDATLASVARSVGYQNQFAFATAFRRVHGVAPGRWRKRAPAANHELEETRPSASR